MYEDDERNRGRLLCLIPKEGQRPKRDHRDSFGKTAGPATLNEALGKSATDNGPTQQNADGSNVRNLDLELVVEEEHRLQAPHSAQLRASKRAESVSKAFGLTIQTHSHPCCYR